MKRAFLRRKKIRQQWRVARALATPAILVVALSACTEVGDFDRPNISIREAASAMSARSDASAYVEERFSDYTLTYKEERMRTLGYRLIQPLGVAPRYRDRITEYRYIQAGFAQRPLSNGDQYYAYLRQNHTRYEDALWNKLIADIRDDGESTQRFTASAERVLEQDALRLEISSTRTRSLPDHGDMVARIYENNGYIKLVTNSVADRIVAYRYAIERAELESPSDLIFAARSVTIDLEYQYQQLVLIGGDGHRTRSTLASNAAYPVIEPPLVDLSGG